MLSMKTADNCGRSARDLPLCAAAPDQAPCTARLQAEQSDFTRNLYKTWYGRALLVILGIAFTAAFFTQVQGSLTRKFHREIKPMVRHCNPRTAASLTDARALVVSL